MTRNEWIAETAAIRRNDSYGIECAIGDAIAMADAIEAAQVAPWQSDPPLTDAAAKVVEAAVAAYDDAHDMNVRGKLWDAVRAYKESVK